MVLATNGDGPRRQAEGAPLPDPLPGMPQGGHECALLPGCYLINYMPTATFDLAYEGTLRVETTAGRTTASGDLYQRLFDEQANPVGFVSSPDPKAGIPIFPIKHYRYYLRVTDLLAADGGFIIILEPLRYTAEAVTFLDGSETFWPSEDVLTARMGPPSNAPPPDDPSSIPDNFPPPPAFPVPELYFVGEVTNGAGTTVGTLKMGFVSPNLRKATIEFHRVPVSGLPMENSAGQTWQTTFKAVGWDIALSSSPIDLEEPDGGSWSAAEADAAIKDRMAQIDLDREWHYHVLAVRHIDIQSAITDTTNPAEIAQEKANGERGFMYDPKAGPDHVNRSGVMIASYWLIPDTNDWGLVRGKNLGETVVYFRTAVHEIGHAMGLQHNKDDNGFMNTTDVVARNSTQGSSSPFPNNISWAFAAADEHRLRHWPDIIVRPGGPGLVDQDRTPVVPLLSDRLTLIVTVVSKIVPLGAPVRINLALSNTTDHPVVAPSNLSLQSGTVRGRIIDSAGHMRTFSSTVVKEAHDLLSELAAGERIEDSLTLFQGLEGELFPAPGDYRVVVEVTWNGPVADAAVPIDLVVTGATQIAVAPPADAEHAEATRKVLATPDCSGPGTPSPPAPLL
jgi:hypothetical protein